MNNPHCIQIQVVQFIEPYFLSRESKPNRYKWGKNGWLHFLRYSKSVPSRA